jgi:hypothetical protein
VPAITERAALVGCIVLCLLLLLVGLFVRLPPHMLSLDLGADSGRLGPQTVQLFGVYGSEQATDGSGRSFRWSSRTQAVLRFYAAQRMQPDVFSLVACGCHGDAQAVPFVLALNERPLFSAAAGDEWRTYHVLVPDDLYHPDSSIVAAVTAPLRLTAEGRPVGLALDQAALQQSAPRPLAAPGSVLLLLMAIAGIFWWRRSLVRPLLLAASWLLVCLAYQPQLLPRWLLLACLIGTLLVLWWLAERVPAPPLLPAALGTWLVLSPQVLGTWVLDDAYISFRYAEHAIQGHGLVYNVGERVEGYTNFLWTLLVASGMAIGGDPVMLAAVLTLLAGVGILLLTVWLARRIVPPLWAWSAAGLLALSTPFLLYTSRGSGMETALFALLVLAALAALAAQQWSLAGLLAALTLLTRPDGAIVAAVGGIYVLLHMQPGAVGKIVCATSRKFGTSVRYTRQAKPDSLSDTAPDQVRQAALAVLLRYLAPLVLLYVPYFLWRWSYYGYLLPNTFYVKVGGTAAQMQRGLTYMWDFARGDVLLLAAIGGVLLGVAFWRQAARPCWPLVGLLGSFVLLFSAYVVVVGGDWMPGARFFVPLLPSLAVLTVWGLAGLSERVPRLLPLAVWLVLAAILVLRLPLLSSYHPDSLVRTEVGVVAHYRDVGRWIYQHTPLDTLIVAGPAGALPFYAQRPTIDALGLNDEYIAHLPSAALGTGKPGHEKSDPDYVLARQPDLIPWSAAAFLRGHPALPREYRLEQVIGPAGSDVRVFVRRDIPSCGEAGQAKVDIETCIQGLPR